MFSQKQRQTPSEEFVCRHLAETKHVTKTGLLNLVFFKKNKKSSNTVLKIKVNNKNFRDDA